MTPDINAAYWRECFDSGMSPEQAFRESFTEEDGLLKMARARGIEYVAERCPQCGGDGRTVWDGGNVCPACDGTGRVPVLTSTETRLSRGIFWFVWIAVLSAAVYLLWRVLRG